MQMLISEGTCKMMAGVRLTQGRVVSRRAGPIPSKGAATRFGRLDDDMASVAMRPTAGWVCGTEKNGMQI